MKKFEGILICTDLDGTLLRADKSVSKENLDAIQYFESEGGLFTFITGRMPFYAKATYDTIRPNAPVGCINGGGIYDYKEGKYLWSQELDRSCLELVEYIDKNVEGIGIQVSAFNKVYFSRDNAAMQRFRERTGVKNLVKYYYDVNEPIAKILFADMREASLLRVQELLLSHPRASEFDFIRSEKTLYEILPKGISKGSVLKRLAGILGIDMKRTVAVGDFNNDISMIRAAGVGVAVDNAKDEVKACADYITVDNEHHAIAKIISDVENSIIKF